MTSIPPNRDRFLAEIAGRVAPERVQAVYLFPPIRQGPVETGAAVLAVDRIIEVVTPVAPEAVVGDAGSVEAAPLADAPPAEPAAEPDRRPVVLTARYRHTLKGVDRGKWELEIVEQADAPLATIDIVVRGVQERLDDTIEPERLDADALRAARADGVWTPPPKPPAQS